jgi:hypothetical protein
VTSVKPLTGSTAIDTTTGISQHASGFTVAGNAAINTNATTYYWLAVRDDGSADFQVGSYTGNGGNPRSLTLLDFTPNALFLMSESTDPAALRMSTMSGDASCLFNGSISANIIESFITNGWTVGNSGSANTNGRVYYYAAFKDSDIFKVLDDGNNRAYQGNSTAGSNDNRTITGAGFTPDAFAFVKNSGSVVSTARFKAHVGDQSADFDSGSSTGSDRIQAFASDGFQVGTQARVNTAGTDYHALVAKEGTSTPPAATGHGALMAGLRNRLVIA